MISRPITPAPRRKNLAEQETEFTSEGAPPPTEVALPVKPGRSGPHESRVPAGISGAHRRAPAGKRRVRRMAIATLLSVPLLVSAGDHDRDHDRDREGEKHRAAMSFNDLAGKDVADVSRGDLWTSRWTSESDGDDEPEGSKRWPHEGGEFTSQVPEPGDAELLLAGLAAIGFVVRRRYAG